MPFNLTDMDVSIIKELLKDGRKSFREISRSTGISTPTVKARFDRLVNVGFIKSVSPVFDFNKIDLSNVNPEIKKSVKREVNSIDQNTYNKIIKKNLEIQLECDFCKGPISGKTHVLKFANIERFFCCFNCRTSYNEKYSGRIEAIKKRFMKDDE
ncbi:MAG: AsnC family transcriptional regulator [Nitrososphaeraceae archaeon]|nr:AsnC family transcriptional regulator [Nitrososphaeraceae archaeon]